ncbi:hypothetical protein PAAG_08588 [Paracoccidioides lutzii Pb01]|uniref:Gpr1 family protein n=1 Tax=Paracoccidioides lutzii (strain ATCC MYA-826 / Pb01) TaxID=502779 RepID=C1HCU7_PARBA|nr:hypothetical protein PAAG_08588 [Paracoccidioides lutzii Pb01]EEH39319.2 hypothetical protein PAAG_08588 [Paracoccidioides lutzii Pb01]
MADRHNNGKVDAPLEDHSKVGTTHDARETSVSSVPRPSYRKTANPGPLGLLGFAITTFVMGLYQCGAGLPGSDPFGSVGPDQAVFGLAVFFGGGAQIIAGIMEFVAGNTFGTTVHLSYGSFWLGFAMFLVPSLDIKGAYAGNERAFSFALGIYLLFWCILTIMFLVASLRTNLTVIAVFALLFIKTSHPDSASRVNKAGGGFAFICALAAFYAGASGLMVPETTFVRLPLGIVSRREEVVSTI